MRDQVLGAVEPAADVGTERDVVTADFLGLEHRVEGRDFVGPHRRQLKILCDRGDQFVSQPAAVLLLRCVQTLQDCRAFAIRRKLGQPVFDVRPDQVGCYPVPSLSVLKISYPRKDPQGGMIERDLHGGQQFAKLVDIDLI